jgi:hypothetical protein
MQEEFSSYHQSLANITTSEFVKKLFCIIILKI